MKRMYVAGAVALALAACGGGGKAQFTIGGTITGLIYDGMVLASNGQTLAVPKNSTTFAMPKQISYGDYYEITIATQPAHQDCVVSYGRDSAGHTAAINALVTCAVQAHPIGGKITGLTGTGLVLTNGSLGGTLPAAANATSYAMASVAYGSTYGVTVLTQPTGQTCTVQNGTGTMGDVEVNNIDVTCVNNP